MKPYHRVPTSPTGPRERNNLSCEKQARFKITATGGLVGVVPSDSRQLQHLPIKFKMGPGTGG